MKGGRTRREDDDNDKRDGESESSGKVITGTESRGQREEGEKRLTLDYSLITLRPAGDSKLVVVADVALIFWKL